MNNIYGTNFSKKVLISYINYPFLEGPSGHSNTAEAIKIANIFRQKKYNVDIINFNAKFERIRFLEKHYDVVFGLEPNFLKAVRRFNPEKSIYYATGSYYEFQNKAEKERITDLKKRKGVLLSAVRYVAPHNSASLADATICIGNNQTKKTYKNKCKQIECVRVSASSSYCFSDIKSEKKWKEAGNNFLWFGSSGAVHKGLDLLLEIFSRNPSLNLYICGNIIAEKDFLRLYKKELFQLPNVHFVGFVKPSSGEFKKIVLKCGFVLMPSCSEGMNSSIPTCMYSGLVPLVSKETGLDVSTVGTVFENNDIKTIEAGILNFSRKDQKWLKIKSEEASAFAIKNNTLNIFEEDFKKALNNIL